MTRMLMKSRENAATTAKINRFAVRTELNRRMAGLVELAQYRSSEAQTIK